jgi:hypothetical protein
VAPSADAGVRAADSAAVATVAGATGLGLNLGVGVYGPPPTGSARPQGLAQLGAERTDGPPPSSVDVGPRSVVQAAVVDNPQSLPTADATLSRLRSAFRRCHRRALGLDPTTRGSVTLSVHVGEGGGVESLDVVARDGLTDSLAACVTERIRSETFDPAGHGKATLRVSVSFSVEGGEH